MWLAILQGRLLRSKKTKHSAMLIPACPPLPQVKELEADGQTLGGLDQIRNRAFGAELEDTERSLGMSSSRGAPS
jgi:hypothetical protein